MNEWPRNSSGDKKKQELNALLRKLTPEYHPDGPDERIEYHFNKDQSLRQICLVRNGAPAGSYGDPNKDPYPNNSALLREVQRIFPDARYEPTHGKDGKPMLINTQHHGKKFYTSFGHKNRAWYFCATLEGYESGFTRHVSFPN